MQSTAMRNATVFVSEFVLHCEVTSEIRNFTVVALAIVYLVTLVGNTLVLLVIILDHHLQTPMFFLIGTLAVLDLLHNTNLIPKMMALLLFDTSPIPFGACLVQMFLVFHLQIVESFLFTVMAYDRYIAVILPLRYPQLVNGRTVWAGVILCNVLSGMPMTAYLIFVHELSFCRTNVLPHCFCDFANMVMISCTENSKYLSFLSTSTTTLGFGTLAITLFSYGRIGHAALKISSAEGKGKVFDVLVTHLLVVLLFYLPLLTAFILPGVGIILSTEAFNTLVIIGTIVPPMINPIIYSFRNKEMKNAIKKLFTGMRTTPGIDEQK
ncbi:olfactory receptor 10A2-like isoform X1 [Erpetoichthys calabaricus]|uniref:olfactory receptor 10A2-like isoform X1 n=1 Tax=Erpetoichthys calabaricus TaxID=27687 RepID=UPI0022349152|nr:olfactory receptor 10A2-like isoform X1 [Erpetoichthys calabaricus]XP_051781874.1 olfactory receptor 10A2-like isoform X1 [Erpetoichthys calabaricus]XP_051781875.1 olfactory receptor 10A2-like isoform X1 [Erpetoichthys calabaricus]XP_051781876.1 olfactory receptor 10A2-like isoform X1 [Erpetoichthys calabaricus]